MLLPDASWKWFIDKQTGFLMVQLSAGLVFQTAYKSIQLHNVPENLFFDIQQCHHFMSSREALDDSGVPFDDSTKTQIALNATAALSFHRPVLNKSWLYEKQSSCLHGQHQQLAWLRVQAEFFLMLTLVQEGNTVLCLNLSESFSTSDGKAHPQFSLISVLSDRLLDFELIGEQSNDES